MLGAIGERVQGPLIKNTDETLPMLIYTEELEANDPNQD